MKTICLTPGKGGVIHRFFDSSPISPSGRYAALFRLPYEDRNPSPGDAGEVIVVDLETLEERVVYQSRGWEIQVGANVRWGENDGTLLFNDVDVATWKPFGVKLNLLTGERTRFGGCTNTLSPDGRYTAAACQLRMHLTQYGYGVIIPDELVPRNFEPPADDGLFVTDLVTGETGLLISLRDIVRARPEIAEDAGPGAQYYGFQSKYSPDGRRLLFVIRTIRSDGSRRSWTLTMLSDGSGLDICTTAAQWARGGHHINWHPDSERMTMNLRTDKKRLSLTVFRPDGSGFREVPGVVGTGHPSVHRDGMHAVTDAYVSESPYKDGTVPLRLINIDTGAETELLRVPSRTPYQDADSSLRLDPHPAWDASGRYVVYNVYENGVRRVYMLDLGSDVIDL